MRIPAEESSHLAAIYHIFFPLKTKSLPITIEIFSATVGRQFLLYFKIFFAQCSTFKY